MAAAAPLDLWPADCVDHIHRAGGDAELAGLLDWRATEAVQSIRALPCAW